ncbi:MAG: hypothetical protein QOF48_117 [Verrucomicrobiota bacterium]|jgi:hypothetical protein
MNTRFQKSRGDSGKILLVTLFLAAAIGLVLLSMLSLIQSQNQAVARSQAWNQCIPVIEAGVEEALAHLNNKKETTLAVNGWAQNGQVYSLRRVVGPDSFFLVNLIATNLKVPVIVCTGYVRLAALVASIDSNPLLAAAGVTVGGEQYVARTVKVIAAEQHIFAKAMVARDKIDMNGNNISTDSYDGSNPLYSTPQGTYDPLKARDHGDISTSSGLQNAINVGNANIKGRLRTGPGGTASVGANGSVGDMAWVNANTRGVKKGWFTDDMNVYFTPPQRPSTDASLGMPSGGRVGTTNYAYLLNSGLYVMSSLNISGGGKLGVVGNARLVVDGGIDISGGLDILPGGSLTVWAAGPSINIGGKGVNNTRRSTNFILYGLSSVTSVSLPNNGDFNGAIYCPTASMQLNGGGSADVNFCGACVMGSIKMNGHYKFHYDEELGEWGPPDKFVVISWVEL